MGSKRPTGETFDPIAQKIQRIAHDAAIDKPQEGKKNKKIVFVNLAYCQDQVSTSSGVVYLTKKSHRRASRAPCNHGNDLATSGKTITTEEGNNRITTAKQEIVFTPIFQDEYKMHVLESYRDFWP